MLASVYRINTCIESYTTIASKTDAELRSMYRRLLEEYIINKHLMNNTSILKCSYFMYLDSVYVPHINYMRQILCTRKIEVDSIDKELGIV